jgi:hypothetical protein
LAVIRAGSCLNAVEIEPLVATQIGVVDQPIEHGDVTVGSAA